MNLEEFYSRDGAHIRIAPEQASRFAKQVAGDFNPIHDVGAKRFCVPGDLLFALVLGRFGLSQRMRFNFAGMVGPDVALELPEAPGEGFEIRDARGKTYLKIERSGDVLQDAALINDFTRSYVAFSGHNFPHILVPLMDQHQVMINPDRPLVIYEHMSFDLQRLDLRAPSLELAETTLDVQGKRGDAFLHFVVKDGDAVVGSGTKKLVLSGLRAYDPSGIQRMVERYDGAKGAHELAVGSG